MKTKFKNFFQYRFEILALVMVSTLFGSAVIPFYVFNSFIRPLSFIVLSIIALALVKDEKKIVRYFFYIVSVLSTLLIFSRIFNPEQSQFQVASLLILISFFSGLSYVVFIQMIRSKEVGHSIIIAAFTNYLLLGLMGSMIITLIIVFDPLAFTGIEQGGNIFDKTVYFSFITLTSIGYGDISPLSPLAEKFTALFGLIAHFYSVVIVGIIVGKFVSGNE